MERRNKEIVFLQGGLGNQMFQYAFYLAKKHTNMDAVYDTGLLRLYRQHNGYELEHLFDITSKVSLINLLLLWLLKKKKFISKVLKPWMSLLTDSIPSMFVPSYLNLHKGLTFYYGYWQTEKYFFDVKDEILKTFSFDKSLLSKQSILFMNQIKRTNSVAVHVRRGDYLNKNNKKVYGGICTIVYYEKAIQKILDLIDSPTFFIFSNEIEWVEKNMYIPNAVYVCCNHKSDSWQDMFLMSQCKHNIIANSSFSLWGAWLNQNSKKIVISPSKFMNLGSSIDLVPETWIKIKID